MSPYEECCERLAQIVCIKCCGSGCFKCEWTGIDQVTQLPHLLINVPELWISSKLREHYQA